MTKTPRKLTEVLNGPLATAITRAIVILSPVVVSVAVYAGSQWLNERIAASPSLVTVLATQARFQSSLESQDGRIALLETGSKLSSASSVEVNQKLDETRKDVKEALRQINRVVGAMEARGTVPPQKDP